MLDAGAVMRELGAMWRAAARQEGSGLLRARAMTILAAAPPDAGAREEAEAAAELMRAHPGRLVLIERQARLKAPEARAAVECWMPFGRRQQICAERVELAAPPGELAALLPAVRGVLAPDLPVALWLRDLELADSAEGRELLALADKVIVDTGGFKDAREAWPALEKVRGGRAWAADLSWTRVTRWRETVQQAFRLPGCAAKLRTVERIEVKWAGEGLPTMAAYLAGWLRGVAPQAALRLACIDPAMPARGMGRIREVKIEGPGLDVRLRRPEGEGAVVESGGLAALARFPRLGMAELLEEELGVLGRDGKYEQALEEARRLTERAE